MAGYYALLGRGPSLFEIAQASGLTRSARDARDQAERDRASQAQQVKFNQDQQLADRDQARKDYELKMGEAKAKREAEAAEAQQQRSANVYRHVAGGIRQGKGANVMPMMGLLQQQGVAEGLQMPGANATPEDAMRFADELDARAAGHLGPSRQTEAPTERGPTSYEEFTRAQSDPAYAAWLQEQERQRLARANAAGGAKTLPSTSVKDISNIDTSIALLEKLEREFDTKVPNEGTIDQVYSYIASKFPNTDVSIYEKEAELAAQKAGLILEEGKLQSTDFPRYKSMTTAEAGNSGKAGKTKIRNTIEALKLMKKNTQGAYGDAGYRVAQPKAQGAVTDDVIDAEIAEIEGVP